MIQGRGEKGEIQEKTELRAKTDRLAYLDQWEALRVKVNAVTLVFQEIAEVTENRETEDRLDIQVFLAYLDRREKQDPPDRRERLDSKGHGVSPELLDQRVKEVEKDHLEKTDRPGAQGQGETPATEANAGQ